MPASTIGTRGCEALLLLLCAIATPVAAAPADTPATLEFSIRDGATLNTFYRQGPVAAHAVLSSGTEPRLVVAFPAGNSGVSLWFEPTDTGTEWTGVRTVRGVTKRRGGGRTLRGIEAEILADTGPIRVREAVLGSVRTIRDYLHTREIPAAVETEVRVDGNTATWHRGRLDGGAGYTLAVEVLNGKLTGGAESAVTFVPPDGGPLHLRVVALTGDSPLTPIESDELLLPGAADDPLSRNVLAYLSYREKLLAGSWRFCTYFGRDTLLSLRLMMPVLRDAVIEAGIGSVLERLSARGEVAHEEDIGEYAVLRHLAAGDGKSDAPLYDYRMIDEDFLLAPIAARYLLDRSDGSQNAEQFLRQKTAAGRGYGDALVANLRYVLAAARPFALTPSYKNLVALKPGEPAGDWRDSEEGLGGGRIPYDVNAVLVPTALAAIERLHASGVLSKYESDTDGLGDAGAMAEIWRKEAPAYFEVPMSYDLAVQFVSAYAAHIGVPADPALEAVSRLTPSERAAWAYYDALALNAFGWPIPVRHSDVGFDMLFGEPSVAELERWALGTTLPFPAGMLTPVGLVVANPVYASADVQALFTRDHYHGTVVWSWQQAMLAQGLAQQLDRGDLPPATRSSLLEARQRLWQAIASTDASRTAELWSWSIADGAWRLEPFGGLAEHRTESNAAQLWSTVYLGIPRP
jgi:hypothetical protein